jgi:tRNA dimethylallyltransferase
MQKYLIVVSGPTAIGKTALSLEIAKKYNSEIISCDSRQFFKEMSIGTAVPSKDELEEVKHHFIQNMSIADTYSVGKFERDALTKIEELHKSSNIVVMVGGSGLYIDAVCRGLDDFPTVSKELRDELNNRCKTEGIEVLANELQLIDPEYHKIVDKLNPHRIIRALEIYKASGKTFTSFRIRQQQQRNFKTVKVILSREREELYQRINKRVDIMLEQGLLEEVKSVYQYKDNNALQTVGYKELFAHLDGEISLEFAISEIKKNTRRYAKRQMTWFRRDPETVFFNPEEPKTVFSYLENYLS